MDINIRYDSHSKGENGEWYVNHVIYVDGTDIADDFEGQNLSARDVNDIFKTSREEIKAAIEKIIHKNARPYIVSRNRVRVSAEVDLETWVRDYANYVKTDVFDCELALDNVPLAELPPEAGMLSDGWLNYGDDLFSEAVYMGLTDEWDGPFTFHITDWEAYDRYIAARVKNEYGHELREA